MGEEGVGGGDSSIHKSRKKRKEEEKAHCVCLYFIDCKRNIGDSVLRIVLRICHVTWHPYYWTCFGIMGVLPV